MKLINLLAALLLTCAATQAAALPQDKLLHFGAGCGVSVVAESVVADTGWDPTTQRAAVLSVVFAVAVGKEIWDGRHPGHTRDMRDVLATLAGGVVCLKWEF